MVDASRSLMMNPLAALSIDRNTLVGENYRPQGGIFYPRIQPLPGEKLQEPGTSIPLGYDLLYKPGVAMLDSQKTGNEYTGLYKSPPPGLQKPLRAHTAGGDNLGLERQVLSSVKQSELCLNGGGSFFRLPWISPYADASMYPFLDMAYKASFLSQPSPFVHQQLAYQSLCASGIASSAPVEERLFYLPNYAPSHISSALGPPIRIHTATPNTTGPLPLSHAQDKTLPGICSQLSQDHSAFKDSPHIPQDSQPLPVTCADHQHGSSGAKSIQPISNTTTFSSKSFGSCGVSNKSCVGRTINLSTSGTSAESIGPLSHALSNSTPDLKSLYRNTPSSAASYVVSQPFSKGSTRSDLYSTVQSGSDKTKDTTSSNCTAEKGISLVKTSQDTSVSQKPSKNPKENCLNLSQKELEAYSSKLEALAKLSCIPPHPYGLNANEPHLKDNHNQSVNKSKKTSNLPESTGDVHSSQAISGLSSTVSSQNSQIINPRSLDHTLLPQYTPGMTIGDVSGKPSPSFGGTTLTSSPFSKSKVEWSLLPPTDSDKMYLTNKGESNKCSEKNILNPKIEAQESLSLSQQEQPSLEKGKSSNNYGESYIPTGFGYPSHYVPYAVADNIPFQHMTITAKGPVYPHPVLLGSSSFYSPHLLPKQGIPYGVHPNQCEFINSQNPVEITPTLVTSLPGVEQVETGDTTKDSELLKKQEQLNNTGSQKMDSERDESTTEKKIALSKSRTNVNNDIIYIDLVRDEPENDVIAKKHSTLPSTHGDSGSECSYIEKQPQPLNNLSPGKSTEERQGSLSHNSHQQSFESSEPPYKCDESPDVIQEMWEPHSPLPHMPVEQTMSCARTSPKQFSRKLKTGFTHDSDNSCNVFSRKNTIIQAPLDSSNTKNRNLDKNCAMNDNLLSPLKKEICPSVCNSSNIKDDVFAATSTCQSRNPRSGISQVPVSGGSFSLVDGTGLDPRFSLEEAMKCIPHNGNIESQSPTCSAVDGSSTPPVNTHLVKHCCSNAGLRVQTCKPQLQSPENGSSISPNWGIINPKFAFSDSPVQPVCGCLNPRACACAKKCCCPDCTDLTTKRKHLGSDYTCNNCRLQSLNNFPLSQPVTHLFPEKPADRGLKSASTALTPGPPINPDQPSTEGFCTNRKNKIGKETQDFDHNKSYEEEIKEADSNCMLDDDDALVCKNQCWSVRKRIANSSGYVGDQLKCVTNELYAVSSQLSREQRALQRAMLRLSELELKEKEDEKEGGEGEKEEEGEEGITAAAEEMELADGQRRDGGRKDDDDEVEEKEEKGEGWERKKGGEGERGWERCQQSERRRRGGRTPSADATEAPGGFQLGHNLVPPPPPLYRHSYCTPVRKEKDAGPLLEQQMKSNKEEHQREEKKGEVEEEVNKKKEESYGSQQQQQQQQQQRFPAAARGPLQENSNLSMAINRRRIFSLEPFHQSSIIRSRQKREREGEGRGEEAEEREDGSGGNLGKKTKLTDADMADGYFDRNEKVSLFLGTTRVDDDAVDVFDSNTDLREHSMLRGMKGYQLTPEDMEFMKTMLEEKMVSNLKKQLGEVERLLQLETIAAAKAFANRQAQEVLENLPRWVKLVLGSNLADVDDLDAEALLNLVSSQEVSWVMQRKKVHLGHMREALENKRKKKAEEEMQLQKTFISEQSKVQVLMTELSDLKSQLVQQESYGQPNRASVNRSLAANNMASWISQMAYETLRNSSQVTTTIKRERAVPEEKLQDAKYHLRSRRREGEKPESMAGLTQGGKNKSAPVWQCPATNHGRDRNKITEGSCKTSSTSKNPAVKPAQLYQEEEEVTSRRLQPTRKSKTVVVTAISQPGGADEPHHAVLKRSKRIANRKLPSPTLSRW